MVKSEIFSEKFNFFSKNIKITNYIFKKEFFAKIYKTVFINIKHEE